MGWTLHMIMCVLLCYPVSIRIYYQQGVLFLVYLSFTPRIAIYGIIFLSFLHREPKTGVASESVTGQFITKLTIDNASDKETRQKFADMVSNPNGSNPMYVKNLLINNLNFYIFIALIHPIRWTIALPVSANSPAKRQKKTSCI